METGNLKGKQDKSVVVTKTMLIQKNTDKNKWQVSAIQILLIVGLTLSLFHIISGGLAIHTQKPVMYVTLVLWSIFWWAYNEYGVSYIKTKFATIGILGLSLIIPLISLHWFLESVTCIVNDIIRQINTTYHGSIHTLSGESSDGTYAMILFFFWLTFLLVMAVEKYQDDLAVILMVLPLIILSVLGGGSISNIWLFFLIVIVLVIIAGASTHTRKKFWGGSNEVQVAANRAVSKKIRYTLVILGASAGTLLLLLSVFVLNPGLNKPVAKLSDAVSPTKAKGIQALYEILPKISGGKLSFTLEGVGGGVSQGELGLFSGVAYDTRQALKITCDQAPEETIYLKGFVGTKYTGSTWLGTDTEDFENAALNWEIQENPSIYIQNLPFLRMMYAANALGEDISQKLNQIQVERLDANTAFTYVPYQAYLNDYYEIEGGDCGVKGQVQQEDIYSFYSVKSYQKIMELWKEKKEKNSVLDDLETVYESYVTELDTQVDKETYSKLWELCREEKESWDSKFSEDLTRDQLLVLQLQKYQKVKTFIATTIWGQCNFTLETWKLPKKKDYVNYFFFEKKTGDSTAFASTAVLMYRMFDIPARYVVGYAAPANLFSTTKDGKCSAVLESDNAHAWVEVYVPEIGWMPVEMTPGFEGTVTNMELSLEEAEETKDQTQEDVKEDTQKTKKSGTNTGVKVLTVSLGILGVVLIFLGRNRYLYRKHRGMMGHLDNRQRIKVIFESFYELLVFLGFPENIDTTQKQFTDTLIKWYSSIDRKELEQFMELVLAANYGNIEVSSQQVAFALKLYEELVHIARNQVKGKQKILFLIWKKF